MLEPIYNALDAKIQTTNMKETIALTRIDGTVNPKMLMEYGVDHFPAILVFRKGQYINREYHGSRDVDSLFGFVQEITAIKPISIKNLSEINKSEMNIYMKVSSKNTPEYALFEKVSEKYIDHAKFYVLDTIGKPEIGFITNSPYDKVETFDGTQIHSEYALDAWIKRICHPVVREITFKNADSIIADQKPLLLLFYREHDRSKIPQYVNKMEQLKDHFTGYNMVIANAEKFKHALGHVRRTLEDAPFVAFDDFKHIYYFGKFEDLNDNAKVKKFIDEYRSGELHRRLHQEMHIEVVIVNGATHHKIENKKIDTKQQPHHHGVSSSPSPSQQQQQPPKDVTASPKKPYFVNSLFQKLLPDPSSFSHVNEINEL